MRCDHVQHLLEEHVDGHLLPLDRAAVEHHLEACGRCSTERARRSALVELLRRLPEDEVPDDFCGRVMESLPEMLPARHGAAHVARWGLVAAAALAVFIAALALLPSLGGPGVAQETFRPLSASLRLGGALLSSTASALATALDAAAAELSGAGAGPKALFGLAVLACNAALAAAVHRYRHAWLQARVPAPRRAR